MGITSHQIKRTMDLARSIGRKMDVNQRRGKRLMTKQFLNSEQIGTGFIQMRTESMAKGMAV